MRKRIVILLLALAVLAGALLSAAAEQPSGAPAGTEYRAVIDDAAGLLDAGEYGSVMEQMNPVTDFCNAGFYTAGTGDWSLVLDKAEEWGKKTFGSDSDIVVFIIDMTHREIAVWSSDGMLKTMTVAKGRQIVGNVYKMATAGRYGDCAKEAFLEIYNVMNGGKAVSVMTFVGNALMAIAGAILLTFLIISTRMEQEIKVSLPGVVTATAGIGAAIVAKKLTRVVHHQSSSGGGRGGGFGGGGGGGGHGGGASHGF